MRAAGRGISRTLWLLLGGVMFMHVADYLIIPILPVVLRDRAFTAGQIGLVLGATSFLFLSGSLLGGVLADRMGRRLIMLIGAVFRSLGVIGLAVMPTLPLVIAAGAVNGLGTGFFAPAVKAAIAAIASGETRTTAFSWRGIAANVGTGAAGLIALLLVTANARFPFYLAAAIHLALAVSSVLFIPQACEGPVKACPETNPGALRAVLGNRPFLVFGAATFVMWALYAQLALALPLRAATVLANARTVGLIWSINSVLVILLQNLITRSVIRRLHPITAMVIGSAFFGAGLTGVGFARSLPALSLAAVTFVMGEMMVLPTYDSTISQLAPAGQVGIFFGLANFISGVGESAGNLFGGQLLERLGIQTAAPWLIYGGLAVLVAGILHATRRWGPLRRALRAAAADPSGPRSAPKAGTVLPDWQDSRGRPQPRK